MNFLLRLVLASVLIYAGMSKIHDPHSFGASIASFQLLPPAAVHVLATALPTFEIWIGILLVTGLQARAALLASLLLFSAFVIALASAALRGIEADCGCFGKETASRANTLLSLARSALLLLLTAWAYWREITRESIENEPRQPPLPG